MRSFWTDVPALFPQNPTEKVWFEVWLRAPENGPDDVLDRFWAEASRVGLAYQKRVVSFPGRHVLIVYGTLDQWSKSVLLLGDVAELRRAAQAATDFVELPPREAAPLVEDCAERVVPPEAGASAVCVLDTGIQAEHPLISKLIDRDDVQSVEPGWDATDADGHGTQMAGLAVFGEALADHLMGAGEITSDHRLESVKLIHPSISHDPDNYGAVTTEAAAIAEAKASERSRVICLAVTADDRDKEAPSSWSAAIDQHAAGALEDGEKRRLYVVSAGNIRESMHSNSYPHANRKEFGIENPAQAWNALTVGASTQKSLITHKDFGNHSPVAPRGGLSPFSRTSMMWDANDWPYKPDVVMEGGNYAAEPGGEILDCDDLRLLTTTWSKTGQQLGTIADTSAATALASRLGARLSAAYPEYWPETIRALIVHSAEWSDQMLKEFPRGSGTSLKHRLRCYGYGVPDEERAFWTAQNAVTLVAQESLTPFMMKGSNTATKECHVHDLPWPSAALEALQNVPITVRVTLSYFIEPSPGRRGWTRKFRYASHGLRFALRGEVESDTQFRKRITKSAWSDEEKEKDGDRPSTAEPQTWELGSKTRTRGSIHSDWFTAPAVEVARAGKLAVYPVTGWWRERHHLGRIDSEAKYALIVTISTPDSNNDLLTEIKQKITVPAHVPANPGS